MAKLNIGAGSDIKEGYTNLDNLALPGIDVIHDLNIPELPFGDDVFEEVYAKDVLEHVDYVPLLRDIIRVLKPGGRLVAMVPHYTSTNMYTDPQHRNFFAIRTFSFFAKDNPYIDWDKKVRYYDFSFSRMERARITFPRHFPWDRVNELLVNLHPKLQMFYELTMWHSLFPAENVEVVLVK